MKARNGFALDLGQPSLRALTAGSGAPRDA